MKFSHLGFVKRCLTIAPLCSNPHSWGLMWMGTRRCISSGGLVLRRLSGGKRCLELGSSALVIEGQGPTLLLSCWLPLQGTALSIYLYLSI